MSDEPELVLAFDTDDPEFARGFEAGALWSAMGHPLNRRIEQYIHPENIEMVWRMMAACEGDWRVVPHGYHTNTDGWEHVILERTEVAG